MRGGLTAGDRITEREFCADAAGRRAIAMPVLGGHRVGIGREVMRTRARDPLCVNTVVFGGQVYV
jgi:hypothetical protein